MASDLSCAVSDASTSFSGQCNSVDISKLFELTAIVAKLLDQSSTFTAVPFRRLSKPRANMTDCYSTGDKIGASER